MSKRLTKPMPVVSVSSEGADGHNNRCLPAHTAIVMTGQLERRFDDYVDANNKQLDSVRDDICDVRDEFREINQHVGNLRLITAKVSSVMENINATLNEQQQIKYVKLVAEVETSKVEKIAEIEDTNDRKKSSRALWLKIFIVIIGIASVFIEHYR
jgi:hypothetical protein